MGRQQGTLHSNEIRVARFYSSSIITVVILKGSKYELCEGSFVMAVPSVVLF
jgi:hypothetical protein